MYMKKNPVGVSVYSDRIIRYCIVWRVSGVVQSNVSQGINLLIGTHAPDYDGPVSTANRLFLLSTPGIGHPAGEFLHGKTKFKNLDKFIVTSNFKCVF